MVRNQENRGGAENARYESTEISKSPYPLPTIQWWLDGKFSGLDRIKNTKRSFLFHYETKPNIKG